MEVRGSHDYHKEINARLERLKLRVQSEFREMTDREQVPSGDDLRRILRPLRKQKLEGQAQTAPEILLAFAEKYKERQQVGGKKVTDSYARKFKQVAGHLENFRPGLHPRDLTEKVWHEYLEYLYEDPGVQDSTVGKHLQAWKVALKETGLRHEHHWLRNTFNSQKLKPDLSWAEVLKLANHKYEDMQLQEAAHAFVIDCQLVLRWGDLSTLTENHLIELNTPSYGTVQCFRKRQGKTGQPVLVPLPPLGAKLFHQYKMVPVPRAARTGTPNLTEYNKRLKKAAEAAGLKRMVAVETI